MSANDYSETTWILFLATLLVGNLFTASMIRDRIRHKKANTFYINRHYHHPTSTPVLMDIEVGKPTRFRIEELQKPNGKSEGGEHLS